MGQQDDDLLSLFAHLLSVLPEVLSPSLQQTQKLCCIGNQTVNNKRENIQKRNMNSCELRRNTGNKYKLEWQPSSLEVR